MYWITPDYNCNIQGKEVSGGLFYVATDDFDDPIASRFALRTAASYGRLAPPRVSAEGRLDIQVFDARAYDGFAAWLSSDRKRLSDTLYLPFYLMGLEYRYFFEAENRDVIEIEIGRIAGHYGTEHDSDITPVDECLNRQLDCMSVVLGDSVDNFWSYKRKGLTVPLHVQKYLTDVYINNDKRFSSRDMMRLVLPNIINSQLLSIKIGRPFLSSISASSPHFFDLWDYRFQSRFGSTITLDLPFVDPAPRVRSRFGGYNLIEPERIGPLLDFDRIIGGFRKPFIDLLMECAIDIERAASRIPNFASKTLDFDKALTLPRDFNYIKSKTARRDAYRYAQQIFEASLARAVRFGSLFSTFGAKVPTSKTVSSSDLSHLVQRLDTFDVAFEPDPRFGDVKLAIDLMVVMYACVGGGESFPKEHLPLFQRIRNVVDVLTYFAARDEVDPKDAYVQFKPIFDLFAVNSTVVFNRSMAYTQFRLRNPLKKAALTRKLSTADEDFRQDISICLVKFFNLAGETNVQKMREAETIWETLKKDRASLYSSVNSPDLPVLIQQAVDDSSVSIPKPEVNALAPGVLIDATIVEMRARETAEVQSLLGSIFVDQDIEEAKDIAPAQTSGFAGLDDGHSQLLSHILKWQILAISDFHEVCAGLGLYPSSCIATINEWGLDSFDEAFLNVDKDVRLDPAFIELIREKEHGRVDCD